MADRVVRISEIGELCLSPVGLSAVTRLAPVRIVGLMMGVWFLSNAFGNKLAGWAAGFFSAMPLQTLFAEVAGVLFVAGIVMFALVRPIKADDGELPRAPRVEDRGSKAQKCP